MNKMEPIWEKLVAKEKFLTMTNINQCTWNTNCVSCHSNWNLFSLKCFLNNTIHKPSQKIQTHEPTHFTFNIYESKHLTKFQNMQTRHENIKSPSPHDCHAIQHGQHFLWKWIITRLIHSTLIWITNWWIFSTTIQHKIYKLSWSTSLVDQITFVWKTKENIRGWKKA